MLAAKFWLFAQDCGWLPLWLATSQNWEKEDRKIPGKNTFFWELVGASVCLASKFRQLKKRACNLHKRRDFLGKNTTKFATFKGRKNRVQIPICRL
jgi:hypothetical protein